MKKDLLFLVAISLCMPFANAQEFQIKTGKGIAIEKVGTSSGEVFIPEGPVPLFSFEVNGKMVNSLEAQAGRRDSLIYFSFVQGIAGTLKVQGQKGKEWKAILELQNETGDTVDIENIVPFAASPDHPYLTSSGPWSLTRAKIFLPGQGPISVILPDNAWELGYGAIQTLPGQSVCLLARRTASEKAEWRRYRTIVNPGGKVAYTLYGGEYRGPWQTGLRLMFHDKYLHDLDEFDETLFDRPDLRWIRYAYIIGLQVGWHHDYYDWASGEYHFKDYLDAGTARFGGYDVFALWPTFPRLGLDERNQWDLYADLPGGLPKLLELSRLAKERGTRFFISYNPWDETTRQENHFRAMARLIQATEADGVVLDTRGASTKELQDAADSVRHGVVMYSEGMAVTKDMPGIVSGRVHNAIFLSPPLNLNKLIKPEFAIFRVCELFDGKIRREVSISFFNGYGTELITFSPGRPEAMLEDLEYLGKTTRILRENTDNFLSQEWTPLIPSRKDSIWINRWPGNDKVLYTVLSFVPEGYQGELFQAEIPENLHAVSLWHHEELNYEKKDGAAWIPGRLDAFNRFDLNTRAEGSVDCIALLPLLLEAKLNGGILQISASEGDEIRVWAGMPTYQNSQMLALGTGNHSIRLMDHFGRYEGKVVIQLFGHGQIMDERVFLLKTGEPRLVTLPEKTVAVRKAPEGMVSVKGGSFLFKSENTDQFIPYPPSGKGIEVTLPDYFMDRYPITNRQYKEFIVSTGYRPADTNNFLKHWRQGTYPPELADHPVVNVSYADAKAYASWVGKRLPTESEWQFAAQGPECLKWPWGNEFDSTRCNNAYGRTTPVKAFPKGASRSGVMDLAGNVWQMTADIYDTGTYYFQVLKGGSYYRLDSSWWYVKGGPRPCDWHQLLLLVSPGFDRSPAVGFRCVADAL